MQFIRRMTEDEVVLEFLASELESTRRSAAVRAALERHGADESLILHADLADETHCTLRRHVLGAARGFAGEYEFPGGGIDWALYAYGGEDLDRTYFSNRDGWSARSLGTRLPTGAAEALRRGVEVEDVSNADIRALAERLAAGETLRPMILLGFLRWLVVEDGNLRLAAYAAAGRRVNGGLCCVGKCRDAGEFGRRLALR